MNTNFKSLAYCQILINFAAVFIYIQFQLGVVVKRQAVQCKALPTREIQIKDSK